MSLISMFHFFLFTTAIFSRWSPSHGQPAAASGLYKNRERKEMNAYVEEMTVDILKDVNLRYQHARRYIKMHEGSANYELGFVAANINDKFRQMILQYKTFSNPENLLNKDVNDHYESLEIVEGLYNEILHERRMFYKALQDREEIEKTTVDPVQVELNKMMASGMKIDPVMLKKYGFGDGASYPGRQGPGQGQGPRGIRRRHVRGWRGDVTPGVLVTNTAHTLSDFQFKKNLRMKAFERKWGNFTPELEGIEVDLTDIL